MTEDEYNIGGILTEHLTTEKVVVPNHVLEEMNPLKRFLGRRTMRLRYLPILRQLDIRRRFKTKTELSGEDERKLYNAQIRFMRDQATRADMELLQKDADRWNDDEILAATYAAIIVKPKMSERQVRAFLRSLDPLDMAEWTTRTKKFLNMNEDDMRRIKNLSAPRRSPSSTNSSEKIKVASGSIGHGKSQPSINTK